MTFFPRFFRETAGLVRGMPLAARVATALFFGAGLADGTLMPFFALWARDEGGVPVEFIGALLACYAAGELLATPLVGGIADRVGRRPVLLVSSAAIGVAASWIETVLPLFAVDRGTLTQAGVGLLFTFAALLGTVFQIPLTRASAGTPPDRLMLASGGALATAFGALLAGSQAWLLVVAVSLATLAGMLAGPVTQALSSDLAPAHARARYMAAYSAVYDLQDAAGPAAGTALYAVGEGLPWFVGTPITLLATIALARTARRAASVPAGPRTSGTSASLEG